MMKLCLLLLLSSSEIIVSSFNCQTDRSAYKLAGRALFPTSRRTNGRLGMAAAAIPIPNPMKKLPWNVQKDKERQERKMKQEAALLYRELGVAEDATFEEIQAATKTLLERYENDVKKKIRVELCKDKILQIRLNERLSGLTEESVESRAATYLQEDAEDFSKKQSKEWEPPKFLQGIVVKPDKPWRDNCVLMFGGMAAGGVLVPSLAEKLGLFAYLLSAGLMGNRGVPIPGGGQRRAFMIGKTGWWALTALVFATFSYIFFGVLAAALTNAIPPLQGNKLYFSLQNLIVCGGLGLTTAYLKPYKGESSDSSEGEE